MDWFKVIKRYYENNLWTLEQVGLAVVMNKITEEQFKEITGQDYTKPE